MLDRECPALMTTRALAVWCYCPAFYHHYFCNISANVDTVKRQIHLGIIMEVIFTPGIVLLGVGEVHSESC